MEKKGENQKFPSKFFCLTVPKKFVVEPFSVSLISGIEKVYASDGYVTIFRRSFFCLAVPKNLAGEPFCAVFQKNSGSEKDKKFKDKRGSIKLLRQKIFVLQFRKIS